MKRVFVLADLQNAYVSMERVFRPDLQQRPVVVLSNNDGCAIARSEEAKQLGIRMAQPYYQWRALEKKHSIAVFSANFSLYGDMSDRFIQVLREFSPDTEPYSIDEVFQEWTALKGIDYLDYALKIRQCVAQWLGLPARLSIAATKTMAKLGQYVVKEKLHSSAKDGVFNFLALSTHELDALLQKIPIQEVWGIGRKLAPKLQKMGMHTAYDLRATSVCDIKKHFGVVVARVAQELQGEPSFEIETSPEDKQQICCSRSFGKPLLTLPEIASAMAHHVAVAAAKLRKKTSLASGLTVFIQTSRFQATPKYENARQLSFQTGSNDTFTLYKTALIGLKSIYRPGFAYTKAGIILWGIASLQKQQYALFTDAHNESKSAKLMRTIDHLNQVMGKGTITLADELLSHKWHAQQFNLSRRYTTAWNELLQVRS
jgi:DNA polymerase V